MQTLLTNARILDPASAEPVEGHVLVEDGIIRDLRARPIAAPDRMVIDLRGRTLMPGLIDCHVHVVAHQMDLAANSAGAGRARRPALAAGDARHARPRLHHRARRGRRPVQPGAGGGRGPRPRPRLVVCGKALSKTGGHADLRPRHDTHDPNRNSRNFGALGRVADGADAVRRACRQELRQGAQFIKIMANGGVASPTDPVAWQGYSAAEMEAAVEEAADAQTYVSAHLYTAEAITRAVAAGVHSLEHCNRIDPAAARAAAARNCVAVPTLVTYEALAQDGPALGLPAASIAKIEDVRAAGMDSLSILQEAGVTMAFGTDLLGPTHARQSEEFAIRARVLPSRDVLAAATTIAARLLRMDGRIGTVAPGAFADLLVVEGDPAQDVALLAQPERNIRLVMKNGAIHRSSLG